LIPRDQNGETSRELFIGYVNCGEEERDNACVRAERNRRRERERERKKENMRAHERERERTRR